MKRIKALFMTLALIISISNLAQTIIAAENEDSTQKEISTLSEEEINKQKQEILSSINSYLEDIKHSIKRIDEKIENTKKQEEFEYYPAIRLNIDTPMFGMSSIVENKLRIKKDVSTTDVANRYSIRDIIDNNKIKLPDGYIAGIVVATTEVSIDENMSLEELKLTLVRCIQYKSQVNAVDEFVETQINKFFKDYIAEEKKNNIRDVKERSAKVKKNIEDIADKIYEMSFIGIDISEYITEYNNVSKELYNISDKSKNTLMSNSELTELIKNSLSNEANVLDLKTTIDEAYEKAVLNMNYLTVLNNLKATYESKNTRIKAYIENSTTETKEESTTESESSKVTITQNYSVTLEGTQDYLEKIIEDIGKKVEAYNKELEENNKELEENNNQNSEQQENPEKTEDEKKAEETEKYTENKAKIEELYSKYKEVLIRENKFYTNNINMQLNDSNTKMTNIIGHIDSDIVVDNEIFTYTKYVYIDLPNNLSGYLERNNSNSMIELNSLNSLLYNELQTLVKTNMNIKKMYEKMTEDLLKS